jgi:hypothetical protein
MRKGVKNTFKIFFKNYRNIFLQKNFIIKP